MKPPTINCDAGTATDKDADGIDGDGSSTVLPDMKEVMRAKEKNPMMFVSGFDADDDGIEISKSDEPGEQLLRSAEEGNLEAVRKLLETNPELINYKDVDGYTALHRASYEDKLDVARELLRKGANVDAKTGNGWTALHSACHWNSYRCVRLLLQCRADINAKTEGGLAPLHVAANNRSTHETLIILLTEPGIVVDSRNNGGETPVELAMRNGQMSHLFEMFRKSVNKI